MDTVLRGTPRACLLMAAAACSGCEPIPNTELVVVVDSDLGQGTELRSVRVVARRLGVAAPMHDRSYAIGAGRFRLPGRVALIAADPGDARPVTVRVAGDVDGRELMQEATVRFASERTLYLHMTLTADCVARVCGAERTCRRGVCVSPEQTPLSDVAPARLPDAGVAAIDAAGVTDATQSTDSMDAADSLAVADSMDAAAPADAAEAGADGAADATGGEDIASDGVARDLGPPADAPVQHCPDDMVPIPGGRFLMGSTRHSTEQPEHAVRVSSFCLERTEVTVADYARCVRAGFCPLPVTAGSVRDSALNWGREDRLDHPINGIRWDHARIYCVWPGLPGGPRRLPTEAEWEFAARGPEGRYFPWGERSPIPGDLCWGGDGGREGTCAVREFPAQTANELFGLAGNVMEWVEDCYAPYVGDAMTEVVDPRPPRCMGEHIARGGGWISVYGAQIRGSARPSYSATSTATYVFGIRCAREIR